MNLTDDDNVGKRSSEEPGDPGAVGSVVPPEIRERPKTPDSPPAEGELGSATTRATGGLARSATPEAAPEP